MDESSSGDLGFAPFDTLFSPGDCFCWSAADRGIAHGQFVGGTRWSGHVFDFHARLMDSPPSLGDFQPLYRQPMFAVLNPVVMRKTGTSRRHFGRTLHYRMKGGYRHLDDLSEAAAAMDLPLGGRDDDLAIMRRLRREGHTLAVEEWTLASVAIGRTGKLRLSEDYDAPISQALIHSAPLHFLRMNEIEQRLAGNSDDRLALEEAVFPVQRQE